MKLDIERLTSELLDDDGPDMAGALTAVTGGAEGVLAGAGIVFIDGAEFMSQELPPPKWIVRDFIAQGMKGDLCGKSKTKKTYLGLQFAVCIATGTDFLSLYHIDTPHVVAYINLELFDWNFQERMSAQMSAKTIDDETRKPCGGLGIDREDLRGRFYICNLRGCAATLRDNIVPLVESLKAKGVEIVFIDPRYKLLKPGEDENTGEGLRGILELRDRIAENFAALLITHDPKGDTAHKSKTDRGAGSYTAGADFDFRLNIDLAEGWKEDNLVYVIEAEGRARKTPPALGVRFLERAQIFRADEDVAALKQDTRLGSQDNAAKRAVTESTLQTAYKLAALKVVEDAGDDLLDKTAFDNLVAKVKGASLAINRRGPMRAALVAEGVLATCLEKERKPGSGQVGNKKNGKTFISTPEHINAYLIRLAAPPSNLMTL